ncbi:unnamed protein product [Candidula unifasciata]|uniref:Uncharacterized protein n=1 Tax=Candidula unifasciata TaxID=100452 RepID=A0A8S3ZQ23_9EUPU|nr:unnamed protein product [Candidula unifasciata]
MIVTVTKCPAIADIIFVLDTSSSMNQNEFELEKQFAIRLTEHFTIGQRDVRFAAISFSDSVQKIFGLKDYADHRSINRALTRAPYLGGSTKTNLALDYIRTNDMFGTAAGGRVKASKIVVVITDGSSDSLIRTTSAANALKSEGLTILAVAIGSGIGIELHAIASGSRNVFRADNFNSLVRIEQKVARRTCEIPESQGYVPSQAGSGNPACQKGFVQSPFDPEVCVDDNECEAENNPCQQDCVNLVGSFRCTCRDGFAADATDTTRCKEIQTCAAVADIIFVLDASGSIGTDNFEIQQQFVAKLTRHFAFGRNGVLFAALLFSTDVQKLFDFNTYSSRHNVSQALLTAPYLTGGTNTHRALNYIRQQRMFSSDFGGRSTAADIVIVLTDGQSSSESETTTTASYLKQDGAILISIGVGNQISPDELGLIASTSQDALIVDDFDWLYYIEQRVSERACRNKSKSVSRLSVEFGLHVSMISSTCPLGTSQQCEGGNGSERFDENGGAKSDRMICLIQNTGSSQ